MVRATAGSGEDVNLVVGRIVGYSTPAAAIEEY
jgi:hypothetical protein